MAPSKLNVVAQVASTAYKAWTTVKDDKGMDIDKNNIISQISTCEGSLESLSDAFKARNDHSIECDDPGAMKIIAKVEDVRDLVNNFKKGIPEAHSKEIGTALDDYLALIKQRNDAVLTFNSALQLYHQALEDVNYYTAQKEELGSDERKIDPNLPAVAFWLRKQMTDVQIDLMQRLNYEGRAIRFWGLVPPFDFNNPAPLQNKDTLEGNQRLLVKAFDTAWESYGQTTWNFWPPPNSAQKGVVYKLNASELTTLRTRIGGVYGVILNFDALRSAHDPASVFHGRANARVNQVRVWLPGAIKTPDASTGKQDLMIEVTQLGIETLLTSTSARYDFSHDPVSIQFVYDCAGVTSLAECTEDRVMVIESIQNDYTGGKPKSDSLAPLGLFADWRIQLRDEENLGLDLSGVKDAYIEFWGRSLPFS